MWLGGLLMVVSVLCSLYLGNIISSAAGTDAYLPVAFLASLLAGPCQVLGAVLFGGGLLVLAARRTRVE